MSNEEKQQQYYLMPENVLKKGKIFSIPTRNWVEALIFGLLAALLVTLIPFVPKIKTLIAVMIFVVVAFLNVRGYKNRSITQIIIAGIRYGRRKRRLHLRSPEYARNIKMEEYENESLVETIVRKVKSGRDDFVEKYGSK